MVTHFQMTFFLDSSGESLHKRGYKVAIFKAPLSECLAAGMILLSGWDQKQPLYDPMCGSGTLLTEAALIARNIAPGLYRDDFGFTHWPDFDKELFLNLQKEARKAEIHSDVQIFGSDVSMQALDETRQNLESAELEDAVLVDVGDVEGHRLGGGGVGIGGVEVLLHEHIRLFSGRFDDADTVLISQFLQ